jgi:flavin-dependent dehydrogenase
MSSLASSSYHIAVIGGGPAGLAATLALTGFGFHVTMLERSEYDTITVGEHLRPEALPQLARLGLEPSVWEAQALPCPVIEAAWGSATLTDTQYLFNPYGDSFLLSRPAFDARLAGIARRRGATVLTGVRLMHVTRVQTGWRLDIRHRSRSKSLAADFLIDATGRASFLARRFGIRQIVHDRLIGIVGYGNTSPFTSSPGRNLLIEACEAGWWYSAPLPGGRVVATWMTDNDDLVDFPGLPLAYWKACLAKSQHTKLRLTGFDVQALVSVRSAKSKILQRLTGDGWLALGDAAMSFDPLSSQGIHKGLYGGLQAADVIRTYVAGEPGALSAYERTLQEAFHEYIQLRAAYYRLEQRWPHSPFWHRRVSFDDRTVQLSLEPMTVLVRKATCPPELPSVLTHRLPAEIDVNLLLTCAAGPLPAHRLVARFQRASAYRHRDRDVIMAVQRLVEAECLDRVAPSPDRHSEGFPTIRHAASPYYEQTERSRANGMGRSQTTDRASRSG